MDRGKLHRTLTVITTLWLTVALFARVYVFAMQIGRPFPVAAHHFVSETAVAAIFVMSLPAIWMRVRWVSHVLVALAVLLLVLSYIDGFTSLWFVSFLLLLFQAYLIRAPVPGTHRAHPAVLLSLVLSRGAMYLGTPAAYLQLSAGAVGAIGGFRQGHRSLATALLVCSLLGLYGLWTMWSISTRTWIHRRYVVPADGRARDAYGLLAAWIALIGLIAISTPIFRGEDMIVLSVLLAPALLVMTAIACTTPGVVQASQRMPLSGLLQRTQVRHYAGMAAGLVAGLLGLAFLLPPTHSGWGPCDWTIMFPIEGDLWPSERGMIFDACATGLGYQTVLLSVASVVFWISGLLCVVTGRSREPWQGAIVATATALIVLTWRILERVNEVRALPLKPLPPISYYIDWVSTLGIAIAVVLWAARLGYLGGRRGARHVEQSMELQ